jgi:hypothetical protein
MERLLLTEISCLTEINCAARRRRGRGHPDLDYKRFSTEEAPGMNVLDPIKLGGLPAKMRSPLCKPLEP